MGLSPFKRCSTGYTYIIDNATPGVIKVWACGYVLAKLTYSNDDADGFGHAMVNAERIVNGLDAMETLERIRDIIDREPLGENLRKLREEIKSALA